jgi:hypothetical protein
MEEISPQPKSNERIVQKKDNQEKAPEVDLQESSGSQELTEEVHDPDLDYVCVRPPEQHPIPEKQLIAENPPNLLEGCLEELDKDQDSGRSELLNLAGGRWFDENITRIPEEKEKEGGRRKSRLKTEAQGKEELPVEDFTPLMNQPNEIVMEQQKVGQWSVQ